MGLDGELPETFVPGFHDASELRKMSYTYLGNTGMKVSKLSFGTGGFSYFYGKFTLEECKLTILEAIKKGINFIDTGPWYGHGESEEVLGKCLEGIPRKAYYIATKVGRYEKDPKQMFDFSAGKTQQSIETSLKRLGVGYIDLIQVHDVEFAPNLDMVINETLPVLEAAVKSGKANHIGITGYPVSTLLQCIEKSKTPIESVLSYCRLTMMDQTLNDFIPALQARNIGIINAAAHSMGLLTNNGPPDWHPAGEHMQKICAEARHYAKENNVELARLALYYSLQQKGPHTHLLGMNTRSILEVNLDVFRNGLQPIELQVYEHIMRDVLSKLEVRHWEAIELERYWNIMKSN